MRRIGLLMALSTIMACAARPGPTTALDRHDGLTSDSGTRAVVATTQARRPDRRFLSALVRPHKPPKPRPHPKPKPRVHHKALGRSVAGIASHMGSTQGPGYLALPQGKGHAVAIFGKLGCVQRVSTDAGPDLAMQRAGRVADLYVGDFERICGPRWLGICPVRVVYGGSCG